VIALICGIVYHTIKGSGNFWVDLARTTFYILIPLSIAVTFLIASQGVAQTFSPFQTVMLLQTTTDANGQPVTEQVLAVDPAASVNRAVSKSRILAPLPGTVSLVPSWLACLEQIG
jgi:K+-transporting ATPase ATPase A chain